MLLKLLGSLLVISASSLLGYVFSREYSRRPQELRIMQALLQMLENEISYLSSVLIDAFEKIYKSTDETITIFFKEFIENLNNDYMDASQAWEKSIRENIKKTALNSEDEEILVSFGKMLGNSNIDGQVKNIKLTINQLKLQEHKAEESRKKNEVLFRNLGVLGGVAIVILLF